MGWGGRGCKLLPVTGPLVTNEVRVVTNVAEDVGVGRLRRVLGVAALLHTAL